MLTLIVLSNVVYGQNLRYLALGDSYTIGERVKEEERFPMQLAAMMSEKGSVYEEVKIIARTGWTTNELQAAIDNETPEGPYDLVTLLIGVNNQYRGREVDTYTPEFESLLQQAIAFAGGHRNRVVVLSIPDWGATPFGLSRNIDLQNVAAQIDAYNDAKQSICKQYEVTFIDITTHYRLNGLSDVAEDKLHPNGKIYAYWANEILNYLFP